MIRSPLAVQILGTGECVPSRLVESAEFDQRFAKPAGWTCEQSGVATRAFVGKDENVVRMGAAAARQALQNAGLDGAQLDAVVAVGSVPAQAIPCTAALVQRELGLGNRGIAAFDVNATCLGFIAALDLLSLSVANGRYDSVLIVASEAPSVGLDWHDPATATLFGDGAAAVVIGKARRPDAALLAAHFQTFSAAAELCQVRIGGTLLHPHAGMDAFLAGSYFAMRGPQLYRIAAKVMPEFVATLLGRAGVGVGDIDVWVPHQASGKAIDHLREALGLPLDRFILTLETHGNQVAASLPVALHNGIVSGKIRSGSVVALVGTGAGFSVGGAVLRF